MKETDIKENTEDNRGIFTIKSYWCLVRWKIGDYWDGPVGDSSMWEDLKDEI